MKWNDSEYREITDKIIKSFYKVHDTLGPGFLEEAYHKALLIELKKHFTNVESEKSFPILYENQEVGKYIPDILVEGKIIIEIKAVNELDENHKAQIISQLRVSGILIGFLVNFAKKELDFRRFDNFYELEKQGLKLD
ncbi:MAG: GxxExxY protein [Planctomycetes bacterium]|nr:GxxExxY protein [Planctomycetota bacterium]